MNLSHWNQFAHAALLDSDVALAIRIFRELGDAAMVFALEQIENVEEKSLLHAQLYTILGRYDEAEPLYLDSSRPIEALNMRRDLLEWPKALVLAETMNPKEIPFLSKEYAQELELTGDHANAIANYEKGVVENPDNLPELQEHNEICQSGVARMAIKTGDLRRGIQLAKQLEGRVIKRDCAIILEQMKQYTEAAHLYEVGLFYDRAAAVCLKANALAKVGELLDKVKSPKIHIQYGKIMEKEKKFKIAVQCYERGRDYDNQIRVLLDPLNEPNEAVKVVRESRSIEGAKLVAKFFVKLGDHRSAIQFLVMSQCVQEAFDLADKNNALDEYASAIEQHGNISHALDLANYYNNKANDMYLAAKFYTQAGHYTTAMSILFRHGDDEKCVELSVECGIKAKDAHLTAQLVRYLLGEDGNNKDPSHLFRLYVGLGRTKDAATTAVVVAQAHQVKGSYRVARDLLFQMHQNLRAVMLKIPQDMNINLMSLHAYIIVKPLMARKEVMLAARCMIKTCNDLSKFPVHAVPILTSAVVICLQANLKKSAHKFASMLMSPEHRSKIHEKYKKKIEDVVRKGSNETDVPEEKTPCPVCDRSISEYAWSCDHCSSLIPWCILTCRHIVADDFSRCATCEMPGFFSEFRKLAMANEGCYMCGGDCKMCIPEDVKAYLERMEKEYKFQISVVFTSEVEPGNVGCTYDEQCEGVWPMTTCQKGQCACSDAETLIETREGNVCVLPGNCPTNEVHGALYERATHRVSTCLTFTSKKDHTQFIGCDEYPEVYDCIAGICCPTRGTTCIQPMSSGDVRDSSVIEEERWWYNSATGQCAAFKYSGQGGNSNNFLTQWQCESYCSGRCVRGDPIPQFSATPISNNDNYFCKVHESDRLLCCPTPSYICSSLGGVNVDKSTMRPFSNGSPRRGADAIQRWYWDTNELACKQFKYYGQGGNFNNFGDKEECVNFCTARLCSHGSPLRDPSDNVQRCNGQTQCPETHDCRHTVCCPRPATTCLQSLRSVAQCEPGETITRWTYSTEHSMCKSVLASRCLLGDNQFDTLEECQTTCSSVQAQPKCPIGRPFKGSDHVVIRCSSSKRCPSNYECVYTGTAHACCPAREYTCHQTLSLGTTCGMSTLQRWYYDPMQNKCNQFEYQGCNGNDNNFVTRLDCMETCHRSDCPDGGEALIDSSNGRIIACEKNEDCPSTHTCTRQLYSNRTSCCPSRKWICSHDANEGVACGTPSKRFYFDPNTETCLQFNYLGCAGNANSFSNRVACYQFCQSASCSSSEIIYQPSNLDEPFDCSLKTCPRHFSCVKSVWDETKNVCCGSPNFGVCSSTQHPMLEFSSQQPMTCTPNTQNSCPMGFQCTYSSIRMLYFCCRDIQRIDKCLQGSRPEIWQSTAEPRSCSRDSQCPMSTSCFTPIPFSSGLCCARTDEVCPATFIYEEEKSGGVPCSPLEKNDCGSDGQSVCLYSDVKAKFVCCRREARQIQALAKCPPGSLLELQKTYCDPENPCPKTHFCMKKSTDRKGICCRHPSLKRANPIRTRKLGQGPFGTTTRKLLLKSRCPKGEKLFKVDGEPKQCGADEDCPEFYKCTSQTNGGQPICCGLDITEICPTKVYPAIKVKKCSLCAVGYECHKNYCCPQKEVACAQPIPFDFSSGNSEDDPQNPTRYYYDSETNTCHSFTYIPQRKLTDSQAQNHFADHESCIDMCVQSAISEEELQCPHPYVNPVDHPQMCITSLKSCADSETCLKTMSGSFVCCQHPPSFQMLMNNLCGASYVPTLNKSGNPIRCSSSSRCQSRICRQSPVLRYSICCQRRTSKPRLLIRPLSEGQIKKPICRSEAEAAMGTCLPKLYPGETECETDEQCNDASTCLERKCTCPKGTVQFRRMCAAVCPIFYKNQNGVCV
ncbi:unnamed protein product [Caenorhabditis sp. 36 PRJEB53466]|nr:unnamed protein product [Caenorhabditis sp. 36 PRJEB53466]